MKILLSILFFSIIYSKVIAQEKLSISGGIIANTMFNLHNYPTGLGANIDVNYRPLKSSFIVISLRTKYVHYSLDEIFKQEYNSDGSSYPVFNKIPDFTYSLSVPQIGIVPKLFYKIDNDLLLFFENDFSIGILTGSIKYLHNTKYLKEDIQENKFIYSPSIGMSFKLNSFRVLCSVGYNFLDFRSTIIKNKPNEYTKSVSRQDTGILFNISINIPVIK